jgi:hypothetical protein
MKRQSIEAHRERAIVVGNVAITFRRGMVGRFAAALGDAGAMVGPPQRGHVPGRRSSA